MSSKKQAADRIREQFFDSATEKLTALEQRDLASVFKSLGDDASFPAFLQLEMGDTQLAQIRQQVHLGDTQAMLDLFMIVARALRYFDALPQNTREALAHGLETTTRKLTDGGDFLPKKRGRPPSSIPDGMLVSEALSIALNVEMERATGPTVEEAFKNIADERGLTEELVRKHWRKNHKTAKVLLKQIVWIGQTISSI